MNIISLLLKHGADINQRSSDGRSPLLWAAFKNNTKLIEFLIENGADVTVEDKNKWNAMDLAIIRMNYEAALTLKKRGMQAKMKEDYENNLWHKYDI